MHTTILPLEWIYYKSLYALFGSLLQLAIIAIIFYIVITLTLWASQLITKQKLKRLLFNKVIIYIVIAWLIIFALFALAPTPADMAYHYSHLSCEVLK